MRTSSIRRRPVLTGLAALSLAVAAALPTGALAQDASPVPGGSLIVAADGAAFPPNLNPAIATSNGVTYISSKVVEYLADAGYDGPVPRLAESWEGSEDGLTFTVKLRDGVTFSDGTPLTSADVKFSAEEAWKPLQNFGKVVLANLETVETPDPLTAVFKFSKPTPPSLVENALPILAAVIPAHIYQGTDFSTPPFDSPLNQQPIGTGPFVFSEVKPGELIRLTKNPTYWGEGQPYLDEIVFQVLPDAPARSAALESGAVQETVFAGVPRLDLARLDALDGISASTTGYELLPYQISLDFNHRRPELADVAVRKAIRQALDPQFIVDNIFLGQGAAEATGPIPSFAKDFYTDDVTRYTFDTAAAEAALDAAGYTRGADGNRFSLRMRVAPFFPESVAAGDYIKQALEEVGIAVEIVPADSSAAYIESVFTDRDFDIAINTPSYRPDPAISTTILYQGGLEPGIPFSNQGGYDNPELNQLIADGLTTVDTEARKAIYDEFQQLVADELPSISLVDFVFTPAHSDRVQGDGTNPRWPVTSWADVWLASE